ncbi:hypothetical protein EP837_03560 [Sphingobium sp. EP60837]|nr:hypothetical protein EP837_03560 [Sphingobium sp. EP60837]
MTVHALHPLRRKAAIERRRAALLLWALVGVMLPAAPAAAQLGGSVSLFSQARLRGQPISDRRPVAELELVHDSASGFYLGGSAALVADRTNGLQPFAFKQYAGFAHRLSPGATLDLGVVHNGYTEYSRIIGGGSYTEAYIGIIGRNLSGRVFISPGYFRKDQATLYMEVDGQLDLARNWVIVSHLGRLTYLNDDRPAGSPGGVTDWRLGLRRHMGSIDLEVAWTGYAEDKRPYGPGHDNGGALVIGLTLVF